MSADFAAELLKLRKRPSVWILGVVLFFAILLFGYVLVYAFTTAAPSAEEASGRGTGESRTNSNLVGDSSEVQSVQAEILEDMLPKNFVANVLPVCSGFGKILALFLGIAVVGGEYSWGTLKSVLTQRSSRVSITLGKLLIIGAVLVGFVLLAFIAGVVGSYTVALTEGFIVSWPDAGELAEGAIVLWLIFMTWAVLGAFFAILFRSTALAVSLSLIYTLVLEAMIASFEVNNAVLKKAIEILPGQSSSSIANSFDPTALGIFGDHALFDSVQDVLVLLFYIAGFSLLITLLLGYRDVED